MSRSELPLALGGAPPMYRVRKVNLRHAAPDGRAIGRRARLQDFQQAVKRLHKRKHEFATAEIQRARTWQAEVAGQGVGWARLSELAQCKTFAVVAAVSNGGAVPSVAEALRTLTAMRLAHTLQTKGVAPCVVALWPGIPAEMDSSPRLVLDRDAQGLSHHTGSTAQADEQVDALLAALPDTEFRPWIASTLRETWSQDPTVWKLRLLFKLVLRSDGLTLPWLPGLPDPASGARRYPYRAGLSQLLREWPVLALVHAPRGPTLSVDVASAAAFGGEVVLFPATTVTVVESKVERWLDRYGLKPEKLMEGRAYVPRLVTKLIPSQSASAVAATKERALAKLFHLEHVFAQSGFDAESVLDKLASHLDSQFDRLKLSVTKAEKSTREHALAQLTKARAYLRPEGMLQSDAMSLLHYIAYYGPSFVQHLAASIEIGDGRHHLIFTGAAEGA